MYHRNAVISTRYTINVGLAPNRKSGPQGWLMVHLYTCQRVHGYGCNRTHAGHADRGEPASCRGACVR